jgi:hypothetical protein
MAQGLPLFGFLNRIYRRAASLREWLMGPPHSLHVTLHSTSKTHTITGVPFLTLKIERGAVWAICSHSLPALNVVNVLHSSKLVLF